MVQLDRLFASLGYTLVLHDEEVRASNPPALVQKRFYAFRGPAATPGPSDTAGSFALPRLPVRLSDGSGGVSPDHLRIVPFASHPW